MWKNMKETEVVVRRRRVLSGLILWRMALTMRKRTAPMAQVRHDVTSSENVLFSPLIHIFINKTIS